jgi:hypothetical protein
MFFACWIIWATHTHTHTHTHKHSKSVVLIAVHWHQWLRERAAPISRVYEHFFCTSISNQLKSGVHIGRNCIQQGRNCLASRCSTHFTQAPLSCHRPLANVVLLHQKENYDLPFTDLYKTHMCSIVLNADILSRIRLRSYNKCGKCIQKFMYAPKLLMDFTPSNKPTNVKVKSNPITGLDRP